MAQHIPELSTIYDSLNFDFLTDPFRLAQTMTHSITHAILSSLPTDKEISIALGDVKDGMNLVKELKVVSKGQFTFTIAYSDQCYKLEDILKFVSLHKYLIYIRSHEVSDDMNTANFTYHYALSGEVPELIKTKEGSSRLASHCVAKINAQFFKKTVSLPSKIYEKNSEIRQEFTRSWCSYTEDMALRKFLVSEDVYNRTMSDIQQQ